MLVNVMAAKGDRGRKPLRAIAQEVGISVSYLHDLLHGRRGGRSLSKWAPKLAAALGVTVDEFLEEVGTVDNRQQAEEKTRRRAPDSPAPSFIPRSADRR